VLNSSRNRNNGAKVKSESSRGMRDIVFDVGEKSRWELDFIYIYILGMEVTELLFGTLGAEEENEKQRGKPFLYDVVDSLLRDQWSDCHE